jgi:bifunctional UDP-N-acetylglucosamine pyrophosphorylase/glucosamine-1-phosphate N-acetyltransferase
MVLHVLDALAELDLDRVVVVVGHGAEWVTKTLADEAPNGLQIDFVEQAVQRGTGDATQVALTGLPDDDEDADVIVLPGDTPLLRPPTLPALVSEHRSTADGRVVRSANDQVIRIVEEADATDEERQICEVNTSIYCFRRALLPAALRRLSPTNAQGEYYLTDVVDVLSGAGYSVSAMVIDDPVETAGVNDRAQLAAAEAEIRDRINERWMRRGVTMWDPERTYIDTTVELAPDVALWPGVVLRGSCVVGRGAEIGPDSTLIDTAVGEGAEIRYSMCEGARVGSGAHVGPFSALGPGSVAADGERVGPFEARPPR